MKKKRQAQVYVFCIHNETDQNKINPLDTRQWEFYVLASKVLNEDTSYSQASTIGINPLLKLGAYKCKYDEVYAAIIDAVKS